MHDLLVYSSKYTKTVEMQDCKGISITFGDDYKFLLNMNLE